MGISTTKPQPDYHPYEPWIDYVVRVSCSGVSVGEAIQLLAATELAALRNERDRLRDALANLVRAVALHPGTVGHDAAMTVARKELAK